MTGNRKVSIGDVWRRPDGRLVIVDDVKHFNKLERKWLLTPYGGSHGKKSWKWEKYMFEEGFELVSRNEVLSVEAV